MNMKCKMHIKEPSSNFSIANVTMFYKMISGEFVLRKMNDLKVYNLLNRILKLIFINWSMGYLSLPLTFSCRVCKVKQC